jgi:mannose-6-phosphate isomerase-like protein (cupin superfamily)
MIRLYHVIALASLLSGVILAPTFGAYGQTTQNTKGTAVQGFVGHIEELAEKNSDFRRVLYTGKKLQLVLMALKPGEDIGEEVHADGDQFFRVEEGQGEVLIDGKRSRIKSGDAVLIPAGARHNIVNTGKVSLHVYTLYSPPEHRDRTVQATKADAEKSPQHFDGKTTE